jgi:hypothetical protein
MDIGNWHVNNEGINWSGPGLQRFAIPRKEIGALQTGRDGRELYEWILLATSEDWLTQDDLFDLNYAFVYAVAHYGVPFRYDIFDATMEEQFEQFDREDEDEL